jgi:hypothetical protein
MHVTNVYACGPIPCSTSLYPVYQIRKYFSPEDRKYELLIWIREANSAGSESYLAFEKIICPFRYRYVLNYIFCCPGYRYLLITKINFYSSFLLVLDKILRIQTRNRNRIRI